MRRGKKKKTRWTYIAARISARTRELRAYSGHATRLSTLLCNTSAVPSPPLLPFPESTGKSTQLFKYRSIIKLQRKLAREIRARNCARPLPRNNALYICMYHPPSRFFIHSFYVSGLRTVGIKQANF